MRMLTRTAAVELGPKGVRVVGIGPGAVATPINTVEMTPESLARLNGTSRSAAWPGPRRSPAWWRSARVRVPPI